VKFNEIFDPEKYFDFFGETPGLVIAPSPTAHREAETAKAHRG